MESIKIYGLEPDYASGTVWVISEGMSDLEEVSTRREAVRRARNKWSMPGQEIRVVGPTGKVDVVRQENPSGQPNREGTDDGLFGSGLF